MHQANEEMNIKNGQRAAWWKRIVIVIAFLAGLVLINKLLCFVLVPVDGSYSQMWRAYANEESIDTVFIGHSVCRMDVVKDVMEEKTGRAVFNLGTDGQDPGMSLLAVKTAAREHEIKTVVYIMDYYTLQHTFSEGPPISFQTSRMEATKTLGNKLLGLADYMTCASWKNLPDSINILFPWTEYHVAAYPANILENIQYKLAPEDPSSVEDYAHVEPLIEHWVTWGDESYNSRNTFGKTSLDEDCLKRLEEIASYCNKNGIDFLVINAPRPPFDITSFGEEYYENKAQIEALLAQYDVDYYDFSLVDAAVFDTTNDDYFIDFEHLNGYGAISFTNALADFLNERAEGKDVSVYFKDKL